jgi:hypothetical protein
MQGSYVAPSMNHEASAVIAVACPVGRSLSERRSEKAFDILRC